MRSSVRDPCGGGRLQHSANLQDGSGSIACTSSDYKVTSDKLRDVELSKDGLSKLNLGSSSSHSDSSQRLTASSSSHSIVSGKTYSSPVVTKTSSDNAPYDRYVSSSFSHSSSSNVKTDLPSHSRYIAEQNSKTYPNIKTDLIPDDLKSRPRTHTHPDLSQSSRLTSVNVNTNSGQLASKLGSQIDQASSHLDASSRLLSQTHSGQSTVGRSIHGLHDDSHSLANVKTDHYGTSQTSKTYGGSSAVDFSGLTYSKTRVSDHSHLHTDSKTNQPPYTKTFDIKGGSVHVHNEKLRFDSVKGGALKDHHGTSVLITDEEERRIEEERRRNIVRLNSSDRLNSHISTNKTDSK